MGTQRFLFFRLLWRKLWLRQSQAANSVHRVRVAILSDRQERVSTLAQQVKLSENAQVIFAQTVLPLTAGKDQPFLRHLRHQGVRVVLFDSLNLEYDLSSIRAIRERAADVAIIAIAPFADLHVMAAAMQAGALLMRCAFPFCTRRSSPKIRRFGGAVRNKPYTGVILTAQSLECESCV